MAETAIDLDNVWKRFYLRKEHTQSVKALLSSLLLQHNDSKEEFWALKGVSFEVKQGETLGIVGSNGSGKSTLLKLITGIMKPNKGNVSVYRKVAALIEIGAGFHPDLTGRENVFLNGSILGMRKAEIARRFNDIVGFAELEEFIDTPVKYYSSGMFMRLGYSIAVHVEPDILLVDEVLAVGDERFQNKCLDKIAEFQRAGKTIIFISHSLDIVSQVCERAILLNKGSVLSEGPTSSIINEYQSKIVQVA